jgi:hypothetical protein
MYIRGRLPTTSVRYSPRAGGIESQLLVHIKSEDSTIIQAFQELEPYII